MAFPEPVNFIAKLPSSLNTAVSLQLTEYVTQGNVLVTVAAPLT